MAIEVNWNRLSYAINVYEEAGFRYKEVPWIVPGHITRITLPTPYSANEIHINGVKQGDLVGSAEQSFLYLLFNNTLETGSYVTLTPCFRDELILNNLTRPYFMKVELFVVHETLNDYSLEAMLEDCKEFFEEEMEDAIDILKTEDGYDLICHGYELGSYSIKQHENRKWLCGTGLAEPRFSEVYKIVKGVK